MSSRWLNYHDLTKDYPPAPILIEALSYVNNKTRAIDIGAGSLRDTRFLLQQGFDVEAFDKHTSIFNYAKELESDKLWVCVDEFEDYPFGEDLFDLAVAIYSLPFCSPDKFDFVFNKIKKSLVIGGVFCGQFFGLNDEWHDDKSMAFHSKEEVDKLLEGM